MRWPSAAAAAAIKNSGTKNPDGYFCHKYHSFPPVSFSDVATLHLPMPVPLLALPTGQTWPVAGNGPESASPGSLFSPPAFLGTAELVFRHCLKFNHDFSPPFPAKASGFQYLEASAEGSGRTGRRPCRGTGRRTATLHDGKTGKKLLHLPTAFGTGDAVLFGNSHHFAKYMTAAFTAEIVIRHTYHLRIPGYPPGVF